MSEAYTETRQGIPIYGLRNEHVDVQVIPDLGAKIVSLRNRQTGREWMWTPPDRGDLFRNRTGEPFDRSTLIGADECIPTIAACTWQGRQLPDHGEAWSEAWSVDNDAFGNGSIVTYLRFPVSPLEMVRSLRLDGSSVRVHYRVTNLADEPTDYMWALHPLMAIEDSDRIVLPAEVQTVVTDSADGLPWSDRGVELAWPQPGNDVDLARMDLGREDACIKLFTQPLTTGRAALYNQASGDYLVFAFDATVTNTLGIWITRGGWNRYQHVALEPGNGAPDPLDRAVTDWQRFDRLQPGETRRWPLNLHLGTAAVAEDDAFLGQFD